MSISLVVDGKLWGLIACHHSTARAVPMGTQLICRHVGAALSAFIHNHDLAERARRSDFQSSVLERTLSELRSTRDPEQHLRSSASQLVRLVDCSGMALLSRGELVAAEGELPSAATLVR